MATYPVPYQTTISHSHSITPQTTFVGGYIDGNYHGYQCGACGQWVHGGHHHCEWWYTQQVQQHVYVQPTTLPDPELQAIKEELKEVRKALEKLTDLAVNSHEEVCRRDNGGSEDPASDTEGSISGQIRIDVTTEAARQLGL